MEPVTWSERTLAAICLGIGLGIAWFSADILTAGAFTRALTRRARLAKVIDFPGATDESA